MIVAAVRLAYFKPRPGQPRKKYTTLYERIDNSSFPSIHAARAVMISFAIYSLAPVLLTVLVLLTVAVLLSRIHFKRHDWKDLLVGIILGIVMGYYFVLLLYNQKHNFNELVITPPNASKGMSEPLTLYEQLPFFIKIISLGAVPFFIYSVLNS